MFNRPLAPQAQPQSLEEDPLNILNDDEGDTTPHQAVMRFKRDKIDTYCPRQLFVVCRSDGVEQLKMDILSAYKNPETYLRATPRVRFEGEEGVGIGSIREFFFLAVKLANEGIDSPSKPIIYFEGERNHRAPVHNQSLRQTGCFKAIGRILRHSFLHGGPSLRGLSPAVKHYFLRKTEIVEPPPLEIKDVPKIELRDLVEVVSLVFSHFLVLVSSSTPLT